jgi:hypothetical protein
LIVVSIAVGAITCGSAHFNYSNGGVPLPLASQPLQYDPAKYGQKNGTCFAPLTAPVAPVSEAYQLNTTGVCKDFITKFYSPAGSSVNSSYTVLEAPWAMQKLVEDTLGPTLKKVPLWISNACHAALLEYICGAAFLYPQKLSLATQLTNNGLNVTQIAKSLPTVYGISFYLPAFPDYKVCTNFKDKCGILTTTTPALSPNCEQTKVLNGVTVRLWPNTTQTIAAFKPSSPLFAGKTIYLKTDPYTPTLNNRTYSYQAAPFVAPGKFCNINWQN